MEEIRGNLIFWGKRFGFQDMIFRTWDLNFGAWIFTLAVSKTETWKLLERDFQDVGSQFWDLDFTQGASHDRRPGIFLAHDFQDMDGEPSDFIVSEGHGHPLVFNNYSIAVGWNIMKPIWCTGTHRGLSNGTKSTLRDDVVWNFSPWQTNKTNKLPSSIDRWLNHL
jgi:hypothetical protein